MAEDRDADAVERMARAIRESLGLHKLPFQPGVSVSMREIEAQSELAARVAFAALCAGPLPRAVLRKAWLELAERCDAEAEEHGFERPHQCFMARERAAWLIQQAVKLGDEEPSRG